MTWSDGFKLLIAVAAFSTAIAIILDRSRKSYDLMALAIIATCADYLIWDVFYSKMGLGSDLPFLRWFRGMYLIAVALLWITVSVESYRMAWRGNKIRRRRQTVRKFPTEPPQNDDEWPPTEIPDIPDEY